MPLTEKQAAHRDKYAQTLQIRTPRKNESLYDSPPLEQLIFRAKRLRSREPLSVGELAELRQLDERIEQIRESKRR